MLNLLEIILIIAFSICLAGMLYLSLVRRVKRDEVLIIISSKGYKLIKGPRTVIQIPMLTRAIPIPVNFKPLHILLKDLETRDGEKVKLKVELYMKADLTERGVAKLIDQLSDIPFREIEDFIKDKVSEEISNYISELDHNELRLDELQVRDLEELLSDRLSEMGLKLKRFQVTKG